MFLTLSLLEGKYAKLTQVDHLWPHKAGDSVCDSVYLQRGCHDITSIH